MNFNSPSKSPVEPAKLWFEQAIAENASANPLAMALSTVDCEGRPSLRMVLLKAFDESGAVFYTNFQSDKAIDIEGNNTVSLLFHWDTLFRQLRIQGTVTKVSQNEADAYFATRDRLSQIGAWASEQSKPLDNRAVLMAKVVGLTAKWIGRKVPRPSFWGGYRVSLDVVEFWQGHDGRLHDRIKYTNQKGWSWQRLQP